MIGYKYAIGPSVSTRVTQRFCDLSSGYRECPECVTSCAVCNRAVAVCRVSVVHSHVSLSAGSRPSAIYPPSPNCKLNFVFSLLKLGPLPILAVSQYISFGIPWMADCIDSKQKPLFSASCLLRAPAVQPYEY